MRLLILGLLIYFGYLILKKWLSPGRPSPEDREQHKLTGVDDVMIKDPFCGTYFPQKSMIKETVRGQVCYFCSKQCRDNYVKKIKESRQ